MRYRTLLLDLDNTLLDFKKSQLATFFDCFPGRDMAFYERFETINKAQWDRLERKEATREEILHERFARFFASEGLAGDPDEMNARYLARLAQGCDKIEHADEVVQKLAKQCTLALVTNGVASVQKSRLADSGLLPYFSAVVISEEVGFTKPDPRIFEIAMQRCGETDKRAVLMIGDSLSADIAGAAAAGIDSCWFNPMGLPRPDGCRTTWEIQSLTDLPAIVSAKQEEVIR